MRDITGSHRRRGAAGGLLGNIIAPGGSETLGTILGAAGDALAGLAVDRNNVRCQ